MLLGENESWSLWGLGSLDSKDISMWGGGGGGGGVGVREGGLDILLLLTLLVIFAESTIITFVELVKVMTIIAFLFGIHLIYKKLLRKEVFYIIYSTLITY